MDGSMFMSDIFRRSAPFVCSTMSIVKRGKNYRGRYPSLETKIKIRRYLKNYHKHHQVPQDHHPWFHPSRPHHRLQLFVITFPTRNKQWMNPLCYSHKEYVVISWPRAPYLTICNFHRVKEVTRSIIFGRSQKACWNTCLSQWPSL